MNRLSKSLEALNFQRIAQRPSRGDEEKHIKYGPLQPRQIRILTLLPGPSAYTPRCTLKAASLDSSADFSALSWSWGPPPSTPKMILVDGVKYPVRPNLYDALIALRDLEKPLDLWIDAISINQENTPEKNSQIPLMTDIYALAKQVIIWIGNAADDSDFIMTNLFQQNEVEYTSARFFRGMNHLLERSWFSRTWVVQEFALNKTLPLIACGYGPRIPYGELAKAATLVMKGIGQQFAGRHERDQYGMEILLNNGLTLPLRATNLKLLQVIREGIQRDSGAGQTSINGGSNLRTVLPLCTSLLATDPRDKIYGILGLLNTESRNLFLSRYPVGYDKSVEQVYREATTYLLCDENSLALYATFQPFNRNSKGPSWVLDFQCLHESVKIATVLVNEVPIQMQPIHFSPDSKRLIAQGILLGEISEVVEFRETITELTTRRALPIRSYPIVWLTTALMSITSPLLNKIGAHNPLDVAKSPYELARASFHFLNSNRQFAQALIRVQQLVTEARQIGLVEPIWKTLLTTNYNYEQGTYSNTAQCQQAWYDILNSVAIQPGLNKRYVATMTAGGRLKNSLRVALGGRAFFMTAEGYYGVSELGVCKGDQLALMFPDKYVPFVVKRKGDAFEIVAVANIPPSMQVAWMAVRGERQELAFI